MATVACDGSSCGSEKPAGVLATSVFERSVNVLSARHLNAKALAFWGKAGAFAWLVLLLCCKIGYRAIVDMHVASEQELCDAAGLGPDSAECAEARLFRSWQASAAAEELLDFRSLLRESVAPALDPGRLGGPSAFVQHVRSPAAPGQRPTPAPGSAPPAAAAGPPAVPAASAEAASAPAAEQPTAAPDGDRQGLGLQAAPARQREDDPGEAGRHARVLREIAEAMCVLCQGPERSGMQECEEFRGVASCAEAGLLDGLAGELAALRADAPRRAGGAPEEVSAERPEQPREAGARTSADPAGPAELRRRLCADTVRRDYPACRDPPPPSTGAAPRLRGWALGAGSAAEVSVEEAESVGPAAWWEGQPPKVACVTAVPDGPEALRDLNVTVDSFRAQSYEGQKELFLVYHARSRGTAELVRSFGDGAAGILAVAAYGEEEYPSPAALRFGAWKSDADLVARWDVGTQHHSRRLSQQVSAMALAGRPACVLAGGAVGGDPAAQEQTLVGEAAWMKRNWFPALPGATPLPSGPLAADLVRLSSSERHASQ